MKAYTNVDQSKRLAEFLPLDSADMWYESIGNIIIPHIGDYRLEMQCRKDKDYSKPHIKIICPCWSLNALLNVLPKPTKRIYELNIYGGDEKPFFGFNDCDLNIHNGFEGDDYVDACVNMIIYMHEKLNAF